MKAQQAYQFIYSRWSSLRGSLHKWIRFRRNSTTLINYFKLRQDALYPPNVALGGSGREAFDRYAAVSVPSMQSTGGEFLFVGPVEGGFMGAQAEWDIAAIGRYPTTDALLSLFNIAAYRDCYIHRTAACERQQVTICDG